MDLSRENSGVPHLSPLQGIRVLDFGRYVAGPYCATLFAEFGADVIRIEPPGGADDRNLAPVMATGEGALFMHVSRNKRSLTLNLGDTAGRAIASQLIATADIVVTNMPRAALPSSGLDYETLRRAKPDIIAVNITAFGNVGPWSDRPGFDSVGQAMCSSVHMSGEPDHPYRASVNWVDYATAIYGAFGAIVALQERRRSGRGQEVSASLLATALSFQNPVLIDQAMLQSNRQPLGNRGFASGPTDLFRCQDGWLICHVVGNGIFKRWTRVLGAPELVGDPRFANDRLRGENGAILSHRMTDWCAQRTRQQALDELAAAKVPAAPVLSPPETLAHPQVHALNLLQPIVYRGQVMPPSLARVPIELSVTPGSIRTPPPELGQHSEEILAEMGYSAAATQRFREANIV